MGGGDSGALTSYSFGQFIPEEDIRAAPFIKMEGNSITLPIKTRYDYEFIAPIDSSKAFMFGLEVGGATNVYTGILCSVVDTLDSSSYFFQLMVASKNGRNLHFFGGTENSFTVPISTVATTSAAVYTLTVIYSGSQLNIGYNGKTIYNQNVTFPANKYKYLVLGPLITGQTALIKQFSLNATKY